MKRESKVIGVVIDGEETWHIVGGSVGDYITACGLDGDDDAVGQSGTITPKQSQKITCSQCKQLWQELKALGLRRSDFV